MAASVPVIKLMAWLFLVAAVFALPAASVYFVPSARDCPPGVAALMRCGSAEAGSFFTRPACCVDALLTEEGLCVDLDKDREFCGYCSVRCTEREDCCNGICTSVYGDNSNCGICGAHCDDDEFCQTIVDDEDDIVDDEDLIDTTLGPVGFPVCSPRIG